MHKRVGMGMLRLLHAMEPWYTVGDRIRVTKDVDLSPFGVVPKGSKGAVAYVEAGTKYTEILMETYHACLHDWHNHLWLIPPDTDEIEAAIQLIQED
jgi:hypothetical protein